MDSAVVRREVQRQVRQAMAALSENQPIPIWLHYRVEVDSDS